MTLPMFVTLAACLTVCVRLICYRRRGARFRRPVSIAAWLLIAANGAIVLRIVLGPYAACPAGWALALPAAALALLVCRARGNIAALIRRPT